MTTRVETPRAPSLRAVAQAIPNANRVVSQRHTNRPSTPPSDQNGHTRSAKAHAEFFSGAPNIGQVHICRTGIIVLRARMALARTKCCHTSVSNS